MQLRQDLRLKQELTLQPQQILRSELLQLPLLDVLGALSSVAAK